MNLTDGIIKFNFQWLIKDLSEWDKLSELIYYRNLLAKGGSIGVYRNGISYGNISIRFNASNKFIISGSGTGKIKVAGRKHFSLVSAADIKKNKIKCEGNTAASSESLTHYVIYKLSKSNNCVIHIHNLNLWKRLFNKVPTTSGDIPYGTPEMADEIKRLWKEMNLKNDNIFVMGGHEEGIVVFGKNLKDTYDLLMKYKN